MSIVSTTILDSYEEIIYIKSDHPTIGLIGVSSFVDSVTGVTVDNYFEKKFRLSKDGGITYGDWLPLTLSNLQSFTFTNYDIVTIEYSYKKIGPTPSSLEFNSVTLTTTNNTLEEGEKFSNSIFKDFFGEYDVRVLEWCLNVTEKLYHNGVLASFIDRFNDLDSSEDFLIFWRSITKFFAYYVVYARQYEKFYESEKLTREYLEQRGLRTSPLNSLSDLNSLMNYYNNEIFKRGTVSIIDRETPSRDWEIGSDIDGEFLRFINYIVGDEFLFNPYRSENFGWNLGNSAPLYSGLEVEESINKIYETNGKITDLDRWPITGVGVTIATDGSDDVLDIVGSGGISSDTEEKFIVVDHRVDYLLTFEVKKDLVSTLTIGMDSYNISGNQVNNISHTDGTTTNLFIEDTELCTDEEYILIRCVLFNSSKPTFTRGSLNINAGNNLIMHPDTVKVVPRIIITDGVDVQIKNITFTPLFTTYSRGFIQVENFISCWVERNNQSVNIQEIEDWTRKYLIPYNDNIRVEEIGEQIYTDQEIEPTPIVPEYDWIGGEYSCTYTPKPSGIFTEEFTEPFM